MLYQNYSFEQSQNQIFCVLKELQIAKLLYKANIRKGCSLSALEMFLRLVMLVFHGKNLFHSLESKHNDLGQDVIGMVKDLKQRYYYNGRLYTLPQLAKIAMDRCNTHLYRSLMVRTRKHHLPVRIVFVRNRNLDCQSEQVYQGIVPKFMLGKLSQ